MVSFGGFGGGSGAVAGSARFEISTDLRGLDSGLKDAETKVRRSVGTFGSILGGLAVAGGIQAFTRFATQSVAEIAKVETSVNKVRTLLPTFSAELQKNLRVTAADMGIGAVQAYEASYQALSASVKEEDLASFLELSAKTAVAGFSQQDTITKALASTVNTFGKENLSYEKTANLFIATQNRGITTADELARSYANVTPNAAALGISMEELSASMATMTAKGVPTAQATTQLRQLFVEASKTGTDLDKAIRNVAGKSFQQLIEEGQTATGIIQSLRDSMPKQEFTDLFGSTEALSAALFTTGENFGAFTDNLTYMREATGLVSEGFDIVSGGMEFQARRLREHFNLLKTSIMGAFTPKDVRPQIDAIIGFMTTLREGFATWVADFRRDYGPTIMAFFDTFWSGIRVVGLALARFARFIVTNKPILVTALTAIGLAFATAIGPVPILLGAIIYGIGVMADNWELVTGSVQHSIRIFREVGNVLWTLGENMFAWVPRGGDGLWANLLGGGREARSRMRNVFSGVLDGVRGAMIDLPGWDEILGDPGAAFDRVKDFFRNIEWPEISLGKIGDAFRNVPNWLRSNVSKVSNWFAEIDPASVYQNVYDWIKNNIPSIANWVPTLAQFKEWAASIGQRWQRAGMHGTGTGAIYKRNFLEQLFAFGGVEIDIPDIKLPDWPSLGEWLPEWLQDDEGKFQLPEFSWPDWTQRGKDLITTLRDGIKDAAGKINLASALSGVLGFLLKLLPFSDAEEGPLSNLLERGKAIVSTLADGIELAKQIIVDAMTGVVDSVTSVVGDIEWPAIPSIGWPELPTWVEIKDGALGIIKSIQSVNWSWPEIPDLNWPEIPDWLRGEDGSVRFPEINLPTTVDINHAFITAMEALGEAFKLGAEYGKTFNKELRALFANLSGTDAQGSADKMGILEKAALGAEVAFDSLGLTVGLALGALTAFAGFITGTVSDKLLPDGAGGPDQIAIKLNEMKESLDAIWQTDQPFLEWGKTIRQAFFDALEGLSAWLEPMREVSPLLDSVMKGVEGIGRGLRELFSRDIPIEYDRGLLPAGTDFIPGDIGDVMGKEFTFLPQITWQDVENAWGAIKVWWTSMWENLGDAVDVRAHLTTFYDDTLKPAWEESVVTPLSSFLKDNITSSFGETWQWVLVGGGIAAAIVTGFLNYRKVGEVGSGVISAIDEWKLPENLSRIYDDALKHTSTRGLMDALSRGGLDFSRMTEADRKALGVIGSIENMNLARGVEHVPASIFDKYLGKPQSFITRGKNMAWFMWYGMRTKFGELDPKTLFTKGNLAKGGLGVALLATVTLADLEKAWGFIGEWIEENVQPNWLPSATMLENFSSWMESFTTEGGALRELADDLQSVADNMRWLQGKRYPTTSATLPSGIGASLAETLPSEGTAVVEQDGGLLGSLGDFISKQAGFVMFGGEIALDAATQSWLIASIVSLVSSGVLIPIVGRLTLKLTGAIAKWFAGVFVRSWQAGITLGILGAWGYELEKDHPEIIGEGPMDTFVKRVSNDLFGQFGDSWGDVWESMSGQKDFTGATYEELGLFNYWADLMTGDFLDPSKAIPISASVLSQLSEKTGERVREIILASLGLDGVEEWIDDLEKDTKRWGERLVEIANPLNWVITSPEEAAQVFRNEAYRESASWKLDEEIETMMGAGRAIDPDPDVGIFSWIGIEWKNMLNGLKIKADNFLPDLINSFIPDIGWELQLITVFAGMLPGTAAVLNDLEIEWGGWVGVIIDLLASVEEMWNKLLGIADGVKEAWKSVTDIVGGGTPPAVGAPGPLHGQIGGGGGGPAQAGFETYAYHGGGIAKTEQWAKLAEGNRPEVILNQPKLERLGAIMAQHGTLGNTIQPVRTNTGAGSNGPMIKIDIHGDNYGLDDLEDKMVEGLVDAGRSGKLNELGKFMR